MVFRQREGRRKSLSDDRVGIGRAGDGVKWGCALSRPVPRSIASTGAYWAARITSVGLEFALPPLGGGYLDRRWGTGSLITILGAILGFVMGMIHLLAISREASTSTAGGGVGIESDSKRITSDESNESGWADHG